MYCTNSIRFPDGTKPYRLYTARFQTKTPRWKIARKIKIILFWQQHSVSHHTEFQVIRLFFFCIGNFILYAGIDQSQRFNQWDMYVLLCNVRYSIDATVTHFKPALQTRNEWRTHVYLVRSNWKYYEKTTFVLYIYVTNYFALHCLLSITNDNDKLSIGSLFIWQWLHSTLSLHWNWTSIILVEKKIIITRQHSWEIKNVCAQKYLLWPAFPGSGDKPVFKRFVDLQNELKILMGPGS